MSRVVSELFVKMAAGVTLQHCSVRRLRLIWIFLGCFSCLYWTSGVTDNGNNFFDGGDNSTANDTSLNCPNVTSENCSQLPAQCLYCGFNDDNFTCVYGLNVTVECSPLPGIYCEVSTCDMGYARKLGLLTGLDAYALFCHTHLIQCYAVIIFLCLS